MVRANWKYDDFIAGNPEKTIVLLRMNESNCSFNDQMLSKALASSSSSLLAAMTEALGWEDSAKSVGHGEGTKWVANRVAAFFQFNIRMDGSIIRFGLAFLWPLHVPSAQGVDGDERSESPRERRRLCARRHVTLAQLIPILQLD